MSLEEHGLIQEETTWVYPYIQAVTDFCKVIDPIYERQIPITPPPERAFASATSKVKIGGQEVKRATIPLPYMSIQLLDIVPDPTRFQSAGYRKIQYSHDTNQTYNISYPEPYDLTFQLDIRHKTNQEWHRIMRAFHANRIRHSSAHIYVPIGLFGKQFHHVEVEGPVDNSDLEPGDNRDRALRKTYTLIVKGWMLNTPAKVTTVRKFTYDEVNQHTDEVLESHTFRLDRP